MTETNRRELGVAMSAIDGFFDGVFAPLEAWSPRLERALEAATAAGPLPGAQLAALVEPEARAVLEGSGRPLYGAGFCGSEAIVAEGNPLAWWQGPERSELAASIFGPGRAAIDLARLEWYRVPRESGRRHVAGPFVDYLCSNEITITSALPLVHRGAFWGVLCADVLLVTIEETLHRWLRGLAGVSLVNAGGRIVVSTSIGYETGDRLRGADQRRGIDALPESIPVLRSERYPFALVVDPEPA